MSNKLKALAVAAVLSVSASANAAIDTFNGNSEFYFNAWDINTGLGYTLDLDWSESFESFAGADAAIGASGNATVLANVEVASSLISGGIIYDGALTGFANQFTDTSNVVWTLGAYDTDGRTRLITTVSNDDAVLGSADVTTSQVKNAGTLIGVQNVSSNAFVASGNNGDLVADEYALTTQADGAAYAGNLGANYANNFINGNVTNGFGETAEMYFYAEAERNQRNPLSKTALVKQLSTFDAQPVLAETYFANGEWNVRISAVPEPQTYAMLLAGLGVMGASARRRIK